MTDFTHEELNELEQIARSATQGEWWVDSHGMCLHVLAPHYTTLCEFKHPREEPIRHEDTGGLSYWENDNDPTHIATFHPEKVLKLIDMARRALEEYENA